MLLWWRISSSSSAFFLFFAIEALVHIYSTCCLRSSVYHVISLCICFPRFFPFLKSKSSRGLITRNIATQRFEEMTWHFEIETNSHPQNNRKSLSSLSIIRLILAVHISTKDFISLRLLARNSKSTCIRDTKNIKWTLKHFILL